MNGGKGQIIKAQAPERRKRKGNFYIILEFIERLLPFDKKKHFSLPLRFMSRTNQFREMPYDTRDEYRRYLDEYSRDRRESMDARDERPVKHFHIIRSRASERDDRRPTPYSRESDRRQIDHGPAPYRAEDERGRNDGRANDRHRPSENRVDHGKLERKARDFERKQLVRDLYTCFDRVDAVLDHGFGYVINLQRIITDKDRSNVEAAGDCAKRATMLCHETVYYIDRLGTDASHRTRSRYDEQTERILALVRVTNSLILGN